MKRGKEREKDSPLRCTGVKSGVHSQTKSSLNQTKPNN